jgi:hypothetical protein
MPSMQRLEADADIVCGLNFTAGEAVTMLALIGRYYGTTIVHCAAHSRTSIQSEY